MYKRIYSYKIYRLYCELDENRLLERLWRILLLNPSKKIDNDDQNNFKSDSNYFTGFDNLIDLSISQVFILLFMSVFPEGTVRYNILQSINTFLSPKKHISASSYYNSLTKLEKKGFIKIHKDKSGKSPIIQATSKTGETLKQLGHLLLVPGLNFIEILPNLASRILNKLGLTEKVDFVLVISQDIVLDVHLYPFIEQYSNHIHAVATSESFQRYIIPYSSEVHQTEIFKHRIREPNDEFDICFLPTFQRRENFFGLSPVELLKEAVRVTKPKGQIIIFSITVPKKTDHFILDSLAEMIDSNPFIANVTKEEVENDLTKVGLKNISVTDINGVVLGIGTVP